MIHWGADKGMDMQMVNIFIGMPLEHHKATLDPEIMISKLKYPFCESEKGCDFSWQLN